MKYYLIAGEASGDLHASNLMAAIAGQDGNAEFRFLGGNLMESTGGTLVRHYKEIAYMGFIPVITHLGTILSAGRICLNDISSWQPDAVILIDYPGFNLTIARHVHDKLHIPVFYYISPKIWAWKSYRIRSIRKYVDRLFSILPFEVGYFAERDFQIDYVGNPCTDAVEAYKNSDEKVEIATTGKPVIAILAGSRRQEISRNLPEMLKAVEGMKDFDIIIAAAPAIEDSFYDKFIGSGNVRIEKGRTYAVLAKAHAALVTSGTATLETALFKVPQIVCYRLPFDFLARLFSRFVLKIKFVSLVNLIADSQVVPELLGSDMNAGDIREQLLPLLSETVERHRQLEGYARIINKLGPAGASQKTATAIIRFLHGEK